ncbi:hypothetical protein LFL96_07635 [Paraburkholderia sp. D15]|nr:hypothetical protein [Paraburkholderia sp. D15]WGS51920.1 hypothetical protein LFL96_07635 [Paraburkholderia sp. D15]
MAGIALCVPGLYPRRAAVPAVHSSRAEVLRASRHPLAAMSPCPLSCPCL